MRTKILDFSSAYAQLILMVFLPIVLLAAVGAYLVEKESSKAIQSEQRTLATAALIRYEPMVKQILPVILNSQGVGDSQSSWTVNTPMTESEQTVAQQQALAPKETDAASQAGLENEASSDTPLADEVQSTPSNGNLNNSLDSGLDSGLDTGLNNNLDEGVSGNTVNNANNTLDYTLVDNQIVEERLSSLDDVQKRIRFILSSMNNNQHIQRVAVIDAKGNLVASSGDQNDMSWAEIANPTAEDPFGFIEGVPTAAGTAYGHLLGEYAGTKYWLFVDMDNEPLTIAQLKVWLGLGVTGLFTLLILLLSLNIYAKRWIAPIYDLRLHLQQITPENMYQPVNTDSRGELNQLQQDLMKTLRRLYGDFQELKDHSDQTEDDLRDAFDEMEMQNIFIREARDQAISSSQAKSAFLANISHELRTPLNSIDGFINLLARHGELTAEQDLYVQTIRKSSAHLLALVNDVLDFSKIEAGKLVLDKHEFSLYSAIYDVMDMLSPLAAEKGLRMAVMYYNDVPNTIIGDALRVKQVLTNLVGNAIKFTDVGEVVVRVGIDEVESIDDAERTDKDAAFNTGTALQDKTNKRSTNNSAQSAGMIHIAIQDTGHGISEKAKTQLFKSFSQGDPSITRQYGGTGLGLVISKQLTRLMGGKIGFYDNDSDRENEQLSLAEPGITSSGLNSNTIGKGALRSGATFWFSIPAHVDVDVPDDIEFGVNFDSIGDEEKVQLPVLRPFAQADGNSDTPFEMLVWINHASSMQVFMAAVRPLNINVTMARSLAGALEKLKEGGNRWDWVIIDGGDSEAREDRAALLKQIRLHYQGKLAIYGYQVALDALLLERYKALGLYQPLDKRQLYRMLDTRTASMSTFVASPTWQGTTVLAVDDHLPNLLVLDALLSELGIKVVTASSGYDAVDIISRQVMSETYQLSNDTGTDSVESDKKGADKKGRIDLIFMDVQMPRMSGDEAAKKIRQIEKEAKSSYKTYNKHIPIIALTAHGLADGKDTLISAGIDDYVGKPISRPQLLQILQRWLGKGGETLARSSIRQPSAIRAGLSESNQESHAASIQTSLNQSNNESSHTLDELAVVDWKDALVRSANKPDLAKQLLVMMQESVPEEIDSLEAAWEMRDREQLAQIAHRILGASRYSGVPQIRQASQDFEDKCLLNVQHTIPAQFEMLEVYYDKLINSLKTLQALDLETYIQDQMQDNDAKSLSENDMTWKMI